MSVNGNGLVQKLWNYCNVLRDDGLSYGDYLEQLTYLLFLKMADEQTKPPFDAAGASSRRGSTGRACSRATATSSRCTTATCSRARPASRECSASSSARRRTGSRIRRSCGG